MSGPLIFCLQFTILSSSLLERCTEFIYRQKNGNCLLKCRSLAVALQLEQQSFKKLNLELLLPFAFGFYLERREGRIKQHARTRTHDQTEEKMSSHQQLPRRDESSSLFLFFLISSTLSPSPFLSTDKSFKGFHTISTGTKLVQYFITTHRESFPLVSQEFHFMVLRSAPSRHFQVV